ncbi:hypothetical protein GCM10027341_04140 [Spirosoma knui]
MLLTACSDSSRTRSLLDEYPVSPTSPLEQRVEVNQLIVDHHGLKYLEPGIYCATINYQYGITLVGSMIINDGIRYGDRTDTIEVEIAKDKLGNGTHMAAFIMNDRKDVYSFPESGDSLTVDVNGESIVYKPFSYMVALNGDISQSSGHIPVDINGQRFFNYDVSIFAKGGRCTTKKTPTVEEILAVNLKHEALRNEAEGRWHEELEGIARKRSRLSADEDAIAYDKIATSGMSQEDMDYAAERVAERAEDRRRTLDYLQENTEKARNRRSLLRNPSTMGTYEAVKTKSTGFLDTVKETLAGWFSSTASKPTIKKLVINSSTQTAAMDVAKGDKITVAASGSITLGFFAGSGDPNGIDGFESYSVARELRHGSLIGRIGDGNWFSVGTLKTFVAPADGPLQLQINDNDPSNNSGSFTVEISVEK